MVFRVFTEIVTIRDVHTLSKAEIIAFAADRIVCDFLLGLGDLSSGNIRRKVIDFNMESWMPGRCQDFPGDLSELVRMFILPRKGRLCASDLGLTVKGDLKALVEAVPAALERLGEKIEVLPYCAHLFL